MDWVKCPNCGLIALPADKACTKCRIPLPQSSTEPGRLQSKSEAPGLETHGHITFRKASSHREAGPHIRRFALASFVRKLTGRRDSTPFPWILRDRTGTELHPSCLADVKQMLLSGTLSIDADCTPRARATEWKPIRSSLGPSVFELWVLFDPVRAWRDRGMMIGVGVVGGLVYVASMLVMLQSIGYSLGVSVGLFLLLLVAIPTVVGLAVVSLLISGGLMPAMATLLLGILAAISGWLVGAPAGWTVGHMIGRRKPIVLQ